jgi:hypothetical protein
MLGNVLGTDAKRPDCSFVRFVARLSGFYRVT